MGLARTLGNMLRHTARYELQYAVSPCLAALHGIIKPPHYFR